jgi:Putative transposase
MAQWDNGGGFSLDASVRIEAHDRRGLERLLRSCARPAFALERLEQLDAHRLLYHLPKPRPDGRTERLLSPRSGSSAWRTGCHCPDGTDIVTTASSHPTPRCGRRSPPWPSRPRSAR